MSFPRGLGLFLIISTIILWVVVLWTGGGISGWKLRGHVDENYGFYEKEEDGSARIPNGNQTITIPPAQPQGVMVSQPSYQDKVINQMPVRLPEQDTEDLEPLAQSGFQRVRETRCGDEPCSLSGDDGFRPVRPKND